MKNRKASICVSVFFVCLAVLMVCASCASIVKQSTQDIPFATKPDSAIVTVTSKTGEVIGKGTTPCTLSLKRGSGYFSTAEYHVLVEKEGFKPYKLFITGNINGWYIGGNLIFGGLIGWLIVDPLTGGMWTLNPEDVNKDLEAIQASNTPSQEGLTIVLKENLPEEFTHLIKPLN